MSEAMRLPKWLDNLIFNELGAKYYPRYADMTNVDDDKEKTLNYLGTYFPRSFAEAYCIFNDFFKKHSFDYKDKTEFSVFDFGCGTGGEIVGLLTALNEHFPSLKKVHIIALDGNQFALSIYDKIITELS